MNDFRSKFTKWYYRKGYRMSYRPCDYGDGVAELIFHCPWWVRPLVEWFFSPCVYYREHGYDIGSGIISGLEGDAYGDHDDEEVQCDTEQDL